MSDEVLVLIGIDCATDPARTGLVRAEVTADGCRLTQAQLGNEGAGVIPTLVEWLPATGRCLLALDAPLGWPAAFGSRLAQHQAGQNLPVVAATFFRRQTDDVVTRFIGKRPLDVAANLIGRTAHMALKILADFRAATGQSIPLAWQPDFHPSPAAIEVYPAGTLAGRGWPSGGYKKRSQAARRQEIIDLLAAELDLGAMTPRLLANADVLDAAVCVLAAHDFCRDQAMAPEDLAQARKEGWIWVRRGAAADARSAPKGG